MVRLNNTVGGGYAVVPIYPVMLQDENLYGILQRSFYYCCKPVELRLTC